MVLIKELLFTTSKSSLLQKMITAYKNVLLNSIRRVLCSMHSNHIVVAGLPRCGTTLICSALVRKKISYYRAQKFLVNLEDDFIGNPGYVYKTHTPIPPKKLNSDTKVIYVFGDPRLAAISIHKKLNLKQAYVNAHSDKYKEHDEIFERDLMRLSDNFSNWYREQTFPFASVRYDAMFEKSTREILESFLGTKLNLPLFKMRESQLKSHPKFEQLQAAYGSLAIKIAEASPVKIWDKL